MCPEEVVKYPNHSAETFNTTRLTRDLGKASRQAKTKWKIVGSSSRREKLAGLVQLEEEVGCAEQREFDDSSNYRGRSCTP